MDFINKRVTVMGLGTRGGGSGVARYLAQHGAIVTVTDLRTPDEMVSTLAELDGLPIRYVLGRHSPEDFRTENADLVVRNPAVRTNAPMLELARSEGVPVTMEMTMFLQACPAPVIGITGTKGKTSTSFICAEILKAMDERAVLAGNMGVSAVAQLDKIDVSTPVVLEISNWQLEGLAEHSIGPHIAVLTNISEDHLNTYDNYADYASVKRSIGVNLNADDWLVLNADDSESEPAHLTAAKVVRFGEHAEGSVTCQWSEAGLRLSRDGSKCTIPWGDALISRQPVQWQNAAAAALAAMIRGATDEQISAGLHAFAGVPHRMEHVAEWRGVDFVNDTAATAPAAALASLRSYPGRKVHLIAGGADKRLDLAQFAQEIAESAASVVLLDGTASGTLATLLSRDYDMDIQVVETMVAAVAAMVANAQPGDVVLLAPGCASFGLFQDEFDRGDRFREAVAQLMTTENQ